MNTMIQVAALANVSQTTVSRVVNGDPKVAEATVKVVKKAMAELNYRPRPRQKHAGAANARTGQAKDHIVLLLVDDSMDSHPSMSMAKLKAAAMAAQERGMMLSVVRDDLDGGLPSVFQRKDLLGVLLWGRKMGRSLPSQISELPHLWISSHDRENGGGILLGNEEAGRLAAEYLLSSGVRYPAALLPKTQDPQNEMRINGFRFACHLSGQEANVLRSASPYDESFASLPMRAQKQVLREMVERIVAMEKRPDSLFIPDDYQTALVYPILSDLGLAPMKDIRIVSCGNEAPYLSGLSPRPATIDLVPETTGRMAVEQLLDMHKSPDKASAGVSILINPRLVPGD